MNIFIMMIFKQCLWWFLINIEKTNQLLYSSPLAIRSSKLSCSACKAIDFNFSKFASNLSLRSPFSSAYSKISQINGDSTPRTYSHIFGSNKNNDTLDGLAVWFSTHFNFTWNREQTVRKVHKIIQQFMIFIGNHFQFEKKKTVTN